MRYIVLDECGHALRKFWTMAEAKAFCLPGYSVQVAPKPEPKPKHWAFLSALNAVGEAPF